MPSWIRANKEGSILAEQSRPIWKTMRYPLVVILVLGIETTTKIMLVLQFVSLSLFKLTTD